MAKKRDVHGLDELNRDHEWMCRQDLTPYIGEWIAVFRRRVVGHNRDLAALMVLLRKEGLDGKALLVPIPRYPIAA